MYYLLNKPRVVEELSTICSDTKQLLWWMRLHIRKTSDSGSIKSPQETLEYRCGSNLEFAWMFAEIVTTLNEECYVVTVQGEFDSSACFFYDDNNTLQCMSNRWTLRGCGEGIESSIEYIDRHWSRWVEWAPINGKLVPIKPHYRDGSERYERSEDARGYLLPGRRVHDLSGAF